MQGAPPYDMNGPAYGWHGRDTGPVRYNEILPEDRGLLYEEDVAYFSELKRRVSGSWVRFDYLNWEIETPGRLALGAQSAMSNTPQDPFTMRFPNTIPLVNTLQISGIARTPDTGFIDLDNMQGTRFSFGLVNGPIEFGGNVWGIDKNMGFSAGPADILVAPVLRPNARLMVTTLLRNGALGLDVIPYDMGYTAVYDIQAFGTEANILGNLRDPIYANNDGLAVKWLAGFRFGSHQELLGQDGRFDNSSGIFDDDDLAGTPAVILNPEASHVLTTSTNNKIYSGQFGIRGEYETRFVTVGFEPKLALGQNKYDVTVVQTLANYPTPVLPDPVSGIANGFNQDNGTYITRAKNNAFVATVDLGAYLRADVTEWMSLTLGYNAIWQSDIARAYNTMTYNQTDFTAAPSITARAQTSNFWTHGISVGGEIRLP